MVRSVDHEDHSSFDSLRASLAKQALHFPDRLSQPDEDRPAHDGMSDVKLPNVRKRGHGLDIEVVERMAGVETHSGIDDGTAGSLELPEGGTHRRGFGVPAMFMKGVGVGAGMKLADRETAGCGGFDLSRIGIDEGRGRDPLLTESIHHPSKAISGTFHVEASLGGHFLTPFGHQHHDLGPDAPGDLDHLVGRGHLQIQLDLDEFLEPPQVLVLDVASILPKVDRDPVRPSQVGLHRGPDGIRLPGPASLPDSGHVVDVHAKFDHHPMLPGPGQVPSDSLECPAAPGSASYTSPTRCLGRRDRLRVNDSDFKIRLDQLHEDIVKQGERVLEQATMAVDAYFDHDPDLVRTVAEIEAEVDRVDVEIERRSIPLLGMGQTDEYAIRSVLTIVKINNEYERIGDNADSIAETTLDPRRQGSNLPDTFRVMANSILGMLRDANRALADRNANLASRVLAFDDTVTQFIHEILRNTQERVAGGELAMDGAFRVLAVMKSMERIADHCTNICEQVIYLETGKIVRHDPDGWTEPHNPDISG